MFHFARPGTAFTTTTTAAQTTAVLQLFVAIFVHSTTTTSSIPLGFTCDIWRNSITTCTTIVFLFGVLSSLRDWNSHCMSQLKEFLFQAISLPNCEHHSDDLHTSFIHRSFIIFQHFLKRKFVKGMIREKMWKWTVAGTTEVPCRRHHHRLPRRSFVGCCGLHHSPGPSFRCSWSSWSSPCFVSSVSRHTSTVRLGVHPYIHSHCAVQTWWARIIVQSTHGLQLVYTNIFVKQRSLALRRHSVTNFCRPLHIGMVKATATAGAAVVAGLLEAFASSAPATTRCLAQELASQIVVSGSSLQSLSSFFT